MGRPSIGVRNLMRGFLAFLFLGLVALGAGAVGYNIGVSQAVATTAGAAGAAVVYAGGWHAGWLLFPFGLLLFPLFLIAFFGFLAFAFGPRRRFGRGWGARDHGYGPMGFGPMGGGWDSRRQWVAEAHRRLHEEEARNAAASGSAGAATTPSDGPTAG
jgi:hypothetical protein